ncbi:hypothetical protein J3Q64DRAFT_1716727 [Phycomyces blakesleeanus]|uniref:Defensin-like protein n=1 Tax=Phycomyces blakesleeanus TaxID=4837 RepID=A0ABR3BGY6_PHYBL
MVHRTTFLITITILLGILHVTSAIELTGSGLCANEEDSSDCSQACSFLVQGNGECIFNQCVCNDFENGECQGDDHESCDEVCQEISPELVGYCTDSQCSCLS